MSTFATRPSRVSTQAQPVRKRGRPHRNGPNRREDIISASTRLFLENGYTDTTLRRIAGAADVNVALVHYYFTSKQGLYQEVLNAALSSTLTVLKSYQHTTLSIDDIARALTKPLFKNRNLSEALAKTDGPPEALAASRAAMRRLHLSLSGCIKSLQRAGSIRNDLDADLFSQTCIDLCWAPFKQEQSCSTTKTSAAVPALEQVHLKRHVEQNILVLVSAAVN